MSILQRFDQKITEVYQRYDAILEYEHQPFDPTQANITILSRKMKRIKNDLKQVDSTNKTQAELLLLAALRETSSVFQARLKNDLSFPDRYIQKIMGKLNNLCNFDNRSLVKRVELMEAILKKVPEVITTVGYLSERVPTEKKAFVRQRLAEFKQLLNRLAESIDANISDGALTEGREIIDSIAKIQEIISTHKAKITSTTDLKAEEQISGLGYRKLLEEIYGIKLDDLLAQHQADLDECNRAFFHLAQKMGAQEGPFVYLQDNMTFCRKPEDMYELLRKYLNLAKENTKKYLALPPEEVCQASRIPEFLKDSYPWGGYYARSHALEDDLFGWVFLNQFNYQDISESWIQLNAVHEAYPGHHVHHVLTAHNDMPAVFKVYSLDSKASLLSEGIAHRSESLFQEIFNDKLFPLFVLYRQLHTAVRVKADLMLHHYQRDEEEVVKFYQNEMHFTEKEARGQVLAHRLRPGYFTVYYTGYKKINTLQQRYQWNNTDFLKLIFSSGKISLDTLEKLMKLPEEERIKILEEFSESF